MWFEKRVRVAISALDMLVQVRVRAKVRVRVRVRVIAEEGDFGSRRVTAENEDKEMSSHMDK